MEKDKKRFTNWLLKEAYHAANVHEALGYVRYSFDQWNGKFPKHSAMLFSIPEMKKLRLQVVNMFKDRCVDRRSQTTKRPNDQTTRQPNDQTTKRLKDYGTKGSNIEGRSHPTQGGGYLQG